jgi:ParB family chromosome partitioning protein
MIPGSGPGDEGEKRLDPKKKGLGRGLSALFGDSERFYAEETAPAASAAAAGKPLTVPIEWLRPSKAQPRTRFDQEALRSLAESIAARGILQPLLVRPIADGAGNPPPDSGPRYEIIAGERRWRAAQWAQLHEVPIVVQSFGEAEALEAALIENLQREDLNAIEEAHGYRRLLEEFKLSQEAVSRIIGKSRSHIANTLRLLTLPEAVQVYVETGILSAGHARVLVGMDGAKDIADEIIGRGLSVREAEELVREIKDGPAPPPMKTAALTAAKAETKSADIAALEKELTDLLGLKVQIKGAGKKGKLVIAYSTLDQLDAVLARLRQGGY